MPDLNLITYILKVPYRCFIVQHQNSIFLQNKWSKVPPMKVGRASPAVASADGLLYVIGGDQTHEVNFYRAQITISSVERYDPLADTWHDCPPLPESRSEAGAVVV